MPNMSVQTTPVEPNVPSVFEDINQRLELIRQRAHELFESRGCQNGHDLEDWLQAEREVFGWSKAELTERNGSYEIQVTLPGFTAKEIDVTAAPQELVIHATSEHQASGERPGALANEEHVLWSEFGSNEIYRRLELPVAIDLDRAQATLQKGILHISAPRALGAPSGEARHVRIAEA